VLAVVWMLGPPAVGAMPPEEAPGTDGWTYTDFGWSSGFTYEYRQRLPDLISLLDAGRESDGEAQRGAEPRHRFHLKGRVGGSLYLDGG